MDQLRPATMDDAVALRDLERAASLEFLGHIFDPSRFPYPDDEVLDRWRSLLTDEEVSIVVVDDSTGLACLVAWDDDLLRHLAVAPLRSGEGLARAALAHALDRSPARRLWCLADNHRARGLYRHLGWRPSGTARRAEWPPYPLEIELVAPSS